MTTLRKYSLWLVALSFISSSCGSKSSPKENTPKPALKFAKHGLLNKRDSQEDQAERKRFLQNTKIQEVDRGLGHQGNTYLLNQRLTNHQHFQPHTIPDLYPVSPLIQSYHSWLIPIRFGAGFPIAFGHNLPEPMVKLINEQGEDLQTLEIFFTPQFYATVFTNNDPGIKAHSWALPETPSSFNGTIYERTLSMAVFESDYDIQKHLKNKTLTPVLVSIHGNKFSPANDGTLNFTARTSTGAFPAVSFWSLVIDKDNHRAAATLHWLMDPPSHTFVDFHKILKNATAGANPSNQGQDFPALVEQWSQLPELQGTPLIQKLKDLIKI